MSDAVVIVESPAKSKTIQGYLGAGFRVVASYGHVRDLPKNLSDKLILHDMSPPQKQWRVSSDNNLRRPFGLRKLCPHLFYHRFFWI